MNIKTILTIAKFGITALTIIPPAVEGAIVLANLAKNGIKNKINNSENKQEINKKYKIRRDRNVISVDFKRA